MTAPHTAGRPADPAGADRDARTDEVRALADRAVDTARRWLRLSAASRTRDPGADRLGAVLSDPDGLAFTVGFVDRVVRTEDDRAAAAALTEIAERIPSSLPAADRAQIAAGAALAPALPHVVVPAARRRLRDLVGHMIIDARPGPFDRAVARLRRRGARLNVNLLGEAVLGEEEAQRHLEDTAALLTRDDLDCVSVKVSSIASQISLWDFEGMVADVCDRLRPLLLASHVPGRPFVNLDMEEYEDLALTEAVFTRLLSEPELRTCTAGVVVQAYLPDALGAVQRLSEFGRRRVEAGGAPVRIRLVKGANLAVERVHAELRGWPQAPVASKRDADANYKRVLEWALRPDRLTGLRIGVAGHNVFDIAFAHEIARARGVADGIEFEMLHGMASAQAAAISRDVGDLLLYVPAVRPEQFDVAVSYLVRRLEENTADENFMSGIVGLANGTPTFRREEGRFCASIDSLVETLTADGDDPPAPRRLPRRTGAPAPASPATPAMPPLRFDFANAPDTDPAVAADREALTAAITGQPAGASAARLPLPDAAAAAAVIARAADAAAAWAGRSADERAEILERAADIVEDRRGDFLAVMVDEAGKTPDQADPEISEAVDFLRWYAGCARELTAVSGARFAPDAVTVVAPPWNFPVAIPMGSTAAALAVGSAVVHKPAQATPRCSGLVVDCLLAAGVPPEVLQLVEPTEGDAGRALISDPRVDRVILTGASETAGLFRSFRPGLEVSAETSGKNALVITPSGDRDLAVADLVHSAFGHAGQKCSAASLAILVGSVADSERFERQLVDAASSLVVGWPQHTPDAFMGPLVEDPSEKLLRALTTLEDGERWLLEPRRLDDTGRLWSPGIRTGVRPGSFFHRTEVFGPVLGLMRADTLDEAIALQNAVDFGLTAGIHSLDVDEVALWLERVEAGNVYVNRGITGAIVRRQPFGGRKLSSVGLGFKAGGPRYLWQLGTWHDASFAGAEHPADRLAEAIASDRAALASGAFSPSDSAGLVGEANILRVQPRPTTIRVPAPDVAALSAASGSTGLVGLACDVARLAHAAACAGAPVRLSVDPQAGGSDLVSTAEEVLGSALAEAGPSVRLPSGAPASGAGVGLLLDSREETAEEFAARVAAGECDDTVGARIRVLGAAETALVEAVVDRPEVAIVAGEATASGLIEISRFVQEQAISMTTHRFGNRDPRFEGLRRRLIESGGAEAADRSAL